MDTKRMKQVGIVGILLLAAPLAARAEVIRRDVPGVRVDRRPTPTIVEHLRGRVPEVHPVHGCVPVDVSAALGVDLGCIPVPECAPVCPPVTVAVPAPCAPAGAGLRPGVGFGCVASREIPERVVLERDIRTRAPAREIHREATHLAREAHRR